METPRLVIGAQNETVEPEHMGLMAGQMSNGRYFHRLFVKDVDTGRF